MQLVCGDHRTSRGNLPHLMPLRLRVVAVQRLMATGAGHRLERYHLVDLGHRCQRPRLSGVPWLPTWPTPTGLTTAALPPALGGSLDGGRDEVRES